MTQYLHNIGDDNRLKFVCVPKRGEIRLHEFGLGGIAHGAAHRVSALEEGAHDPHSDVAVSAGHKDFVAFDDGWHVD